ncbi:MAG: RdgB/HAM1 family non-canonical purine NTP pyrophosphatase [Alphaproteobacteria bacterium]|nr:RdgB/HAM1 family non-canonical purine NTP pyrophosphatase [Alphaproteobacteria bacterium]
MARRFVEPKLVLATHNPGKVGELVELLAPWGVEVVSAGELGLPEPEETGETFVDNALLKARAASAATGLPALADDSGLSVAGLGGRPGVHTADWAGAPRDFNVAMRRVQGELGTNPDRRAAFMSTLALVWPDGHEEVFEGKVDGILVWPPRGDIGWGYDPMFAPEGANRTYGEMSAEEKHATSHRARALAKLVAACFGRR